WPSSPASVAWATASSSNTARRSSSWSPRRDKPKDSPAGSCATLHRGGETHPEAHPEAHQWVRRSSQARLYRFPVNPTQSGEPPPTADREGVRFVTRPRLLGGYHRHSFSSCCRAPRTMPGTHGEILLQSSPMRLKPTLIALAAVAALPGFAHASPPGDSADLFDMSLEQLMDVVVTSVSKRSQPLS